MPDHGDVNLSNPAWAIDYVVLSGGVGPDSEWGQGRSARPWGRDGDEYDGVPHRILWRGKLRFIRRRLAPSLHTLAENINLDPSYLLECFQSQVREFCILDSIRRGNTFYRQAFDPMPVDVAMLEPWQVAKYGRLSYLPVDWQSESAPPVWPDMGDEYPPYDDRRPFLPVPEGSELPVELATDWIPLEVPYGTSRPTIRTKQSVWIAIPSFDLPSLGAGLQAILAAFPFPASQTPVGQHCESERQADVTAAPAPLFGAALTRSRHGLTARWPTPPPGRQMLALLQHGWRMGTVKRGLPCEAYQERKKP